MTVTSTPRTAITNELTNQVSNGSWFQAAPKLCQWIAVGQSEYEAARRSAIGVTAVTSIQ